MTEPETTAAPPMDVRRKRLKYRAWHRGTREMDFLMGSFADAHVDGFSEAELDQFEAVIQISDDALYKWKTGRETPPSEALTSVLQALLAHVYVPGGGE